MELLDTIVNDLFSNYDFGKILKLYKKNDTFSLHFSICMYIRNEFLYCNEENRALLSKHYGTTCIDDLSFKILHQAIDTYKRMKNFKVIMIK